MVINQISGRVVRRELMQAFAFPAAKTRIVEFVEDVMPITDMGIRAEMMQSLLDPAFRAHMLRPEE